MIGQTVGNFKITGLLGEGGMGVVYIAEHPGIGRRAAVKVLNADHAHNPEIVNRFFNEARAANAVSHPGIVEVFDFGTLPSGASYIVMELLKGESLAARLRRVGRMPPEDARDLGAQAAGILTAAHTARIVHRDLKPDNIFLVPNHLAPRGEMVKILDFGIAKLGMDAARAAPVKTRTGSVMGTPTYMSPEQCRGTREVDHRTDIYALGIILYEMVCGAPPFVSEGFGEMAHLHISEPPPTPRSRNPAVPADIEAVILKSLAKNPADRFQAMAEVGQALVGRSTPIAVGVPVAPRGSGTQALSSGGGGGTREYGEAAPPASVRGTTFSGAASQIGSAPPSPRGPLRARLLVALGVVVVGGAVLAAVVALRRPDAPASAARLEAASAEAATSPVPSSGSPAAAAAPVPAPSSPPSTAPSSAAAPAAAPAGSAGAPREVTVAIESEPSGAEIVRETDGAVLGTTPLRRVRAAASGVEKLRIEMNGYLPEAIAVARDDDRRVNVRLKRQPPPPARPAAASVGGPAPKRTARATETPGKKAPGAATAPAAAAGAGEPAAGAAKAPAYYRGSKLELDTGFPERRP